jgi:hypothetical protein
VSKTVLTHFVDFVVRQLRVVGPVEVEEMVAGPSTLLEDTPNETKCMTKAKSKGKGKAKQIRAAEEVEDADEEMVMRLMEKKIEVEILWKEIDALQGMLED